jgi:predicted enzyme related to lactoylglutathione lyase
MSPAKPDTTLYLTEIKVTDWSGMVRWYAAILGLRLALEDAAHQYALLEAGTGAGRIALKGGRAESESLPSATVRLVFEVANVDAQRDRLAGCGVAVSLPEESLEGYRAIRLCDPEGMPITLFSWKAAGSSSSEPCPQRSDSRQRQ